MAGCLECGEPLVMSNSRRYYCENERCPVIYVQRPHHPTIRRVVHTSLPNEDEEQAAA